MRIVPAGEAIVREGQQFTRLTVIGESFYCENHYKFSVCRCECGVVTVVSCSNLKRGMSRSCGCLKRELASKRLKVTGEKHPTFQHGFGIKGKTEALVKCWWAMHDRCKNPKNKAFHRYGGRGIEVCEEWSSVEAFGRWALSNGWQKGLSLDRVNNEGNYEPENCRWTTNKVQSRNTSRTTFVEFGGQRIRTIEAYEMSEKVVPYKLFLKRIRCHGWSVEKAGSLPANATQGGVRRNKKHTRGEA